MSRKGTSSSFDSLLLRPKKAGEDPSWAFVILPRDASEKLPRRGRTTIEGTINGHEFQALAEPDGQKGHWLKIDRDLLKASSARIGDLGQFKIAGVAQEPEPDVPADLMKELRASPESLATWEATTTIARIDWIHWITSAKQAGTRAKRISDACDMLASGEKRVCCFDPSGYYSKALKAPEAAD